MTRGSLRFAPWVAAALFATDALAAQRVFVRSNGVDTGTCTLAAPCRSFAYGMEQVDTGGEIVALDAAGYGLVAIDRSVTITTNGGFFAGISAASEPGISIFGTNTHVVLRGLAINGLGAFTGIDMQTTGSLAIENCVISNFVAGINSLVGADVRIANTSVTGQGPASASSGISILGGGTTTLHNVRLSNHGNSGLAVGDGGDTLTRVIVTESEATGNGIGYQAYTFLGGVVQISIIDSVASNNGTAVTVTGTGASASISSSVVAGNFRAFENLDGTLASYGNNLKRYNTAADTGTVTSATGQ